MFPWDLAVRAPNPQETDLLAGGLTPEGNGEAVKTVQPFAVDVASGVVKSPSGRISTE